MCALVTQAHVSSVQVNNAAAAGSNEENVHFGNMMKGGSGHRHSLYSGKSCNDGGNEDCINADNKEGDTKDAHTCLSSKTDSSSVISKIQIADNSRKDHVEVCALNQEDDEGNIDRDGKKNDASNANLEFSPQKQHDKYGIRKSSDAKSNVDDKEYPGVDDKRDRYININLLQSSNRGDDNPDGSMQSEVHTTVAPPGEEANSDTGSGNNTIAKHEKEQVESGQSDGFYQRTDVKKHDEHADSIRNLEANSPQSYSTLRIISPSIQSSDDLATTIQQPSNNRSSILFSNPKLESVEAGLEGDKYSDIHGKDFAARMKTSASSTESIMSKLLEHTAAQSNVHGCYAPRIIPNSQEKVRRTTQSSASQGQKNHQKKYDCNKTTSHFRRRSYRLHTNTSNQELPDPRQNHSLNDETNKEVAVASIDSKGKKKLSALSKQNKQHHQSQFSQDCDSWKIDTDEVTSRQDHHYSHSKEAYQSDNPSTSEDNDSSNSEQGDTSEQETFPLFIRRKDLKAPLSEIEKNRTEIDEGRHATFQKERKVYEQEYRRHCARADIALEYRKVAIDSEYSAKRAKITEYYKTKRNEAKREIMQNVMDRLDVAKKRYDACALDQDEDDFEINMQSGRSRQLRRRRQEQPAVSVRNSELAVKLEKAPIIVMEARPSELVKDLKSMGVPVSKEHNEAVKAAKSAKVVKIFYDNHRDRVFFQERWYDRGCRVVAEVPVSYRHTRRIVGTIFAINQSVVWVRVNEHDRIAVKLSELSRGVASIRPAQGKLTSA
eukprot:gene334-3701_t